MQPGQDAPGRSRTAARSDRVYLRLWHHGRVHTRLDRFRRWIGGALVVYGALGVLASLLVATAGMAFADATRASVAELDAERASAVSTIAASELVIGQVADGVASAQEGLASASTLVTRAGGLTASLAATSRNLAAALDVEILGQKPFASVVQSVLGVATTADQVATDLGSTAASLGNVANQVPGIAAGLRSLSGQLADARVRLGELGTDDRLTSASGSLGVAVGILLAWLFLQAAACVAFGLALVLWKPAVRDPAPTPDPASPLEPS
jgi:hypothetical protein